jgi:hypothetical protein
MPNQGTELRETWEYRDGKVVAAGDAALIDDWLATKLDEVRTRDWRILYQHRDTGQYWELSYPQSEMHGGGPRLLRRLAIASPDQWPVV